MLIVVDRNKTGKLLLLGVLLTLAGFFWVVTGQDRLQIAQTTASPPVNDVSGNTQSLSPSEAAPENPGVDAVTQLVSQPGKIEVKMPQAVLFDEYRLERDRARSAQVELLQATLSDRGLTESRRDQLTNELFALLQRGEKELQAETLLKAKGYTDAVVVLGVNGANAVVPDVLERDDAARVGELVARATGVSLERITIIDGAAR